MAVNIQRARDHGLPDYNTARRYFGLEPLESLDPKEYQDKTGTFVNRNVIVLATVFLIMLVIEKIIMFNNFFVNRS